MVAKLSYIIEPPEESSFKLAEEMHNIFLENMEKMYRDILTFLGFVIPALSGFLVILSKYDLDNVTKSSLLLFLVGTLIVIAVLAWGGTYTLVLSYRYRYLQASAYMVEKKFRANLYIPDSFKPKPLRGIQKRLFLSLAPGILQVHAFFFIFCIIGICFISRYILGKSSESSIILIFSFLSIILIYYFGSYLYPKKLNKIIENLDNRDRGM